MAFPVYMQINPRNASSQLSIRFDTLPDSVLISSGYPDLKEGHDLIYRLPLPASNEFHSEMGIGNILKTIRYNPFFRSNFIDKNRQLICYGQITPFDKRQFTGDIADLLQNNINTQMPYQKILSPRVPFHIDFYGDLRLYDPEIFRK